MEIGFFKLKTFARENSHTSLFNSTEYEFLVSQCYRQSYIKYVLPQKHRTRIECSEDVQKKS